MNDKARARNYYAAAVLLFQDPSEDDCEVAIELLNKAVELYPNFSEGSIFREEVWHYLLTSLDGAYGKYLEAPAWQMKRIAIIRRDGGQCVCGTQVTEVHHKTYKNIGKEPLSDLVALCKKCHEREHEPRSTQPLRGQEYWDGFKTYVEKNGNQLQLFPEPDLPTIYGIQIDRKTRKSEDIRKAGALWLVAYRDSKKLQANLCIKSLVHYSRLKKEKDSIEKQFEDDLGELKWNDRNSRVGFLDYTVGHVDRANADQEFSWLHDRLTKLHEVFQPLVLK